MSKQEKTQGESTFATIDGVSPLLLGNCSHLAGVSTRDLVELSKATSCRLVFEDEELYRQGDASESVFLLLDGAFRFRHRLETGAVSDYEEGSAYTTFGDLALMGELERRYSATATRDSIVLEIPIRQLILVLGRNDAAAIAWRGAIMARLHRKQPQLASTLPWRILGKLSELFQAA